MQPMVSNKAAILKGVVTKWVCQGDKEGAISSPEIRYWYRYGYNVCQTTKSPGSPGDFVLNEVFRQKLALFGMGGRVGISNS